MNLERRSGEGEESEEEERGKSLFLLGVGTRRKPGHRIFLDPRSTEPMSALAP